MPGRIPEEFVAQLLARIDLVTVVSRHVRLKKTGQEYSGLCPFHSEKTASFTVVPHKGFFHCFGCGASGNAIGFLMKLENKSFQEAVESLAASVGLETPKDPEALARLQAQKPLLDALSWAADFYAKALLSENLGGKARKYLDNRSISAKAWERFRLGYAPPGNSLKAALQDRFPPQVLEDAGLLIAKDGDHYDRFRNRIMFPIRNLRGQVIGFGGRGLSPNVKPKYLNSPETEVFHKGLTLYGIHESRRLQTPEDSLIFVEGYTDVLALSEAGIVNSVACLGTALSREHLETAFSHCDKIVLCFDGDEAGRKAAQRSLEPILDTLDDKRRADYLFLPEGEDPDSFLRVHGEEKFLRRLKAAQPFSEYFFDTLATGLDLRNIEDRTRFTRAAISRIRRVKGTILASLLEQQLKEIVGLERLDNLEEYWEPQVVDPKPFSPRKVHQQSRRRETPGILLTLEARVIRPILKQPSLAGEISEQDLEVLRQSGDSDARLLYELCMSWRKKPTNNAVILVTRFRDQPATQERLTALEKNAAAKGDDLFDWDAEFRGAWPRLQRKWQKANRPRPPAREQ